MTYSYQWQSATSSGGAGQADIGGATNTTYILQTSDAHHYIRSKVTADDGHGGTTAAYSAWTLVADTAPANSVAPAISGGGAVGDSITATNGTWSDADGDTVTYTYQWYRASDNAGTGSAAIAGATAASYTLTTSDAHKYVRCVVTADDGNGSSNQTANSAWTAVTDTAPTNSAVPTISGTATVTNALTATHGTWADADNDTISYTYQWYRASDNGGAGSVAIAGATAASYTLTTSDAHKYVKCVVTANDGNGSGDQTATSTWTAITDTAPTNSVVSAISGIATVTNALSASTGTWSDADGDTVTYTYQWYRAGDNAGTGAAAIAGATGSSYTLTTSDAHKYVRCVVTANDGNGSGDQTAASAWTAITDSAPANSIAPTITGSAILNSTITAGTGTWADADGDSLRYSYQWYRADDGSGTNSTVINSATSASYTVAGADAGKFLRCVVTANDGNGSANQTASTVWTSTNTAPTTGSATVSNSGAVGQSFAFTSTGLTVRITYSDTDGNLNAGTIDTSDLIITRTSGSGSTPVVTGVGTSVNGNSVTVIYTIMPASGASWSDAFNGGFRIDLADSQVSDSGTPSLSAAAASGVATFSVGMDTTAPPSPSKPSLALASDSGWSSSDGITSATTPTFGGTAEAGSTLRLYDGSTLVATTTTGGDGHWSVATSALGAGGHIITARATDAAGNVGAISDGRTIVVETAAPTSVGGTLALPNQAGTGAEVGTVSASDPGGQALRYELTDTAGGRFVIDQTTGKVSLNSALSYDYTSTGRYPVTVKVTDAAGLSHSETITVKVTLSSPPPPPATPAVSPTVTLSAGPTPAGTTAPAIGVGTVGATDTGAGNSGSRLITIGAMNDGSVDTGAGNSGSRLITTSNMNSPATGSMIPTASNAVSGDGSWGGTGGPGAIFSEGPGGAGATGSSGTGAGTGANPSSGFSTSTGSGASSPGGAGLSTTTSTGNLGGTTAGGNTFGTSGRSDQGQGRNSDQQEQGPPQGEQGQRNQDRGQPGQGQTRGQQGPENGQPAQSAPRPHAYLFGPGTRSFSAQLADAAGAFDRASLEFAQALKSVPERRAM